MSVVDSPAHRKTALQLAQKSIVMLKNDGILPLKSRIQSVAVVGPNIDTKETLWGNYNGTPTYTVTPLQGIVGMKRVSVDYAQGCTITGTESVQVVPAGAFVGTLKRELFRNKNLEGSPVVSQSTYIDENWGEDGPEKGLVNNFSIRWTGKLKASTAGTYTLGVKIDDGARLWVDGKLFADAWANGPARVSSSKIDLKAGQVVDIKLEYFEATGFASCQLVWSPPGQSKFLAALEAVSHADVVIACVGLSPTQEDEEGDRTSIELPAVQLALLKAIKAKGKPIIAVLINGGPVSSPWLSENCSAVLESWYGGQEAGTAIAETLFGVNNPAGRLPVTVYHSTNDLPDFANYDMTNRTYRYDARKPLYSFGYGLSYSKFAYSNWEAPKQLAIGKDFVGHVTVTNTSARDGDEVVQLYLSRPGKDVAIRELRWFKRINVPAKKSFRVEVRIQAKDLAVHNMIGDRILEPGKLTVTIGGGQIGTPGLPTPLSFGINLTGSTKIWK